MHIKVQIDQGASVTSIVECENFTDVQLPLTFIAFSDVMKARVLESFLKSPAKIGLSIYDGEIKTGEWHEAFAANAVFNHD